MLRQNKLRNYGFATQFAVSHHSSSHRRELCFVKNDYQKTHAQNFHSRDLQTSNWRSLNKNTAFDFHLSQLCNTFFARWHCVLRSFSMRSSHTCIQLFARCIRENCPFLPIQYPFKELFFFCFLKTNLNKDIIN